jgi:YD repeat-containing protein
VTTYTQQIIDGVSVIREIEGCSTCGSPHERFEYDQRLNLVAVTSIVDGKEITTRYAYDDPALSWKQRGNILEKIEAKGLSEERKTGYAYTYDQNDPLLIAQRIETKPSTLDTGTNRTITTTYDKGNHISREETGYVLINGIPAPETHRSGYEYNSLGQLIRIDGPRKDVSDITTIEYYPNDPEEGDNRGQIKAIVNAMGQQTSFSEYDANGNVGKIIDPNGSITIFTYDERNRIKTISNQPTGAKTEHFYDSHGNLSSITTLEGNPIHFTFNLKDRLTEIRDSSGNTILYQYDQEGNRTREETQDPQGTLKRSLDFTYDAYNRLKRVINPDARYTEYGYDGLGNRVSIRDPRGNLTTYAYDNLSRLVTMTQPYETLTRYNYDRQDHLSLVIDPNGNPTQ